MIEQTLEVRRIERVHADRVALWLAPPHTPEQPWPSAPEHRIEVPVDDECPTGTRWTVRYEREVAE